MVKILQSRVSNVDPHFECLMQLQNTDCYHSRCVMMKSYPFVVLMLCSILFANKSFASGGLVALQKQVQTGNTVSLLLRLPRQDIINCRWTLKDANVYNEQTEYLGLKEEIKTVVVTYNSPGEYSPTLIIEDASGQPTSIIQVQISVTPSYWAMFLEKTMPLLIVSLFVGIVLFVLRERISLALENQKEAHRILSKLLFPYIGSLKSQLKLAPKDTFRELPCWLNCDSKDFEHLLLLNPLKPFYDRILGIYSLKNREQGNDRNQQVDKELDCLKNKADRSMKLWNIFMV